MLIIVFSILLNFTHTNNCLIFSLYHCCPFPTLSLIYTVLIYTVLYLHSLFIQFLIYNVLYLHFPLSKLFLIYTLLYLYSTLSLIYTVLYLHSPLSTLYFIYSFISTKDTSKDLNTDLPIILKPITCRIQEKKQPFPACTISSLQHIHNTFTPSPSHLYSFPPGSSPSLTR